MIKSDVCLVNPQQGDLYYCLLISERIVFSDKLNVKLIKGLKVSELMNSLPR